MLRFSVCVRLATTCSKVKNFFAKVAAFAALFLLTTSSHTPSMLLCCSCWQHPHLREVNGCRQFAKSLRPKYISSVSAHRLPPFLSLWGGKSFLHTRLSLPTTRNSRVVPNVSAEQKAESPPKAKRPKTSKRANYLPKLKSRPIPQANDVRSYTSVNGRFVSAITPVLVTSS